MDDTLAVTLKRLLEERDLSSRALSRAAGLNETAVRDILIGRSKVPRYETLNKIANALGVPLGVFMPAELTTGHKRPLNINPDDFADTHIEIDSSGEAKDLQSMYRNSRFVGSFIGLDLTGADLTRADMSNTALAKVNFTGANLTNTNFTNAILRGCIFRGAIFEGTVFFGADLKDADFGGADLTRAAWGKAEPETE